MKKLSLIALAAIAAALIAAVPASAKTTTLGTAPTGVSSNKPLRLFIDVMRSPTDLLTTVDYTALGAGQAMTFTVRHCPNYTYDTCAQTTDESHSVTGGAGTTHLEIDLGSTAQTGGWEEVAALSGRGKVTATITDYVTTPDPTP